MAPTILVKVIGFTDVERHALNTVCRLSEGRETRYAVWSASHSAAPDLLLIDSASPESEGLLVVAGAGRPRMVWVGASAPAHADHAFDRPLHWPHVLQAMEHLFSPPPPLDFDFDIAQDLGITMPAGLTNPRRGLIVNVEREQRLYLRARMALAGIVLVGEADTGRRALDLIMASPSELVIVDTVLPDMSAWTLIEEARASGAAIPEFIVTTPTAGWLTRLRARLSGIKGCLGKPLDPARLGRLLAKA
ncbi:MAG: response regulator [Burkholderiaceae bacterium]|nr:response regulator [Burkholderiaceae bacterium]MDO9089326.1 response regulator [Burkholderiaceae bacterium]